MLTYNTHTDIAASGCRLADIGQGDLVWQQACKTSFKLTKRVTPEMVS